MRYNKIGVAVLCLVVISAPILAQTPRYSGGDACTKAQMDAQMHTNGALWAVGSGAAACCLSPLLGIGVVAAAYVIEPAPPAMALMGKSPEYVATYTECYRNKAKSVRTSNAWTGCITGTVLSVIFWAAYYVLVIAATAASY